MYAQNAGGEGRLTLTMQGEMRNPGGSFLGDALIVAIFPTYAALFLVDADIV
jgi:hypothetical protein